MKAPEKIYLATTKGVQNLDNSFVGIAHSDPQDIIEPIEYIRKDAFMEKACKLLARMVREVIYKDLEGNFVEHYEKMEFIEDFKKYMKGEKL